MKKIRFSPLFFRRVHKWVGLILGIQFILWAISGAMMATIDMEAMKARPDVSPNQIPAGDFVDPAAIVDQQVTGFAVRSVGDRPIYEVSYDDGIRLFDARTGNAITVDPAFVRARAEEIAPARIKSITRMDRPNLEARDYEGAVWRVDFADAENSSAYFSAASGELLTMRGDTWRLWDFFWMLHNMDYLDRSSFNHPLIIIVAFGTLFLSGTGFYLLFKSFTKRDFSWIVRRKPPSKRVLANDD